MAGHFHAHVQPPLLEQPILFRHRLAHEPAHVHLPQLQVEVLGFEPRQVVELRDEPLQGVRLASDRGERGASLSVQRALVDESEVPLDGGERRAQVVTDTLNLGLQVRFASCVQRGLPADSRKRRVHRA